jgi:hypothetical protein
LLLLRSLSVSSLTRLVLAWLSRLTLATTPAAASLRGGKQCSNAVGCFLGFLFHSQCLNGLELTGVDYDEFFTFCCGLSLTLQRSNLRYNWSHRCLLFSLSFDP